jgi:formylglycine-generating enzyme required for sulfatase activity
MRSALREAAPALWQPGGAGWSNQAINNPASNQGAQGNFYGPVYFGQPAADEQEAARQQAEAEEQAQRQREQEAARKRAEEQQRQEAAEQAKKQREAQERQQRKKAAHAPTPPSRPGWLGAAVGIVVLLAAVGLFLAFGPGGDETGAREPTPEPVAEVEDTETPTRTPEPTATPEPPTATRVPTRTPAPTAEPTPLPATIETEVAPGVTMEFVEVPAGPFLMGSSDDDPDADGDEKPQHELTLPTYYIGRTEVTNAQYRPFVEGDGYTNPAYWSDDGWAWREENNRTQPTYWNDSDWNDDEQPVNRVSWYECMAYARWLSAQTGDDYRLPTEAEWEKAARGTEGLRYPWGNQEPTDDLTNFNRTVGRTTAVGNYPAGASPYGALDMAGNVWEWTRSVYQDYPYDPDDGRENISNPSEKRFTVRGGGWDDRSNYLRASVRFNVAPDDLNSSIGCRLARHLP